MFGCVLENTIENTFSTCCSHFLTFSWLPNEYIISFIPQITNKTQKKKSSNPDKQRRDRDLDRRNRDRRDRDRSFARTCDASIGAVSGSFSLSLSLSRCVCSLSVFYCVLAECVSLFCACYGNRLKVKQLCKMISGSTSVNFGQTEIIFRKIYFP